MRSSFLAGTLLAVSLSSLPAAAAHRSFVFTRESHVLGPGESELEPWTTFRAGRGRYYSAIDGRLELEHGLLPGLQLGLYWNFATRTFDVVQDSLTRDVVRVSESEFASVSAALKYQLTDPTADVLGSALYFEATLGPRESELGAKLIVDRALGRWLVAANVSGELQLEPVRGEEGSELETEVWLEPTLAAAYQLTRSASLGLELRAPLGLSQEAKSATLFGGPVVRWSEAGYWMALGVQPQLAAFVGQSPDSRLDLNHQERVQARLLAGFML